MLTPIPKRLSVYENIYFKNYVSHWDTRNSWSFPRERCGTNDFFIYLIAPFPLTALRQFGVCRCEFSGPRTSLVHVSGRLVDTVSRSTDLTARLCQHKCGFQDSKSSQGASALYELFLGDKKIKKKKKLLINALKTRLSKTVVKVLKILLENVYVNLLKILFF